ncbi:BglB-family transcriptional antiterminator [Citrobacter koseri]|uniref:BglB-family transcriptional antiterminator n=1 Tax=Citrobacter koseri TaxID=545 RepID=A0A3S5DP36_CITKO|nr:BglB-family transcriptional antiterminator [Citrobacter koseri]
MRRRTSSFYSPSSKSEYEEAMAIYDIFVTFLRERAMTRLCASQNFAEFKAVAMECVSRF